MLALSYVVLRRLAEPSDNDVYRLLAPWVPIMLGMPDNRAFYDRPGVLDTYLEHREWADNPNTTIERPTFYALAGDLSSLDIINLGCGYGDFGLEALKAGSALLQWRRGVTEDGRAGAPNAGRHRRHR
jgi:hypothetical protein